MAEVMLARHIHYDTSMEYVVDQIAYNAADNLYPKSVSQINIADEADGALLTYDANADLEGPSPTIPSSLFPAIRWHKYGLLR